MALARTPLAGILLVGGIAAIARGIPDDPYRNGIMMGPYDGAVVALVMASVAAKLVIDQQRSRTE